MLEILWEPMCSCDTLSSDIKTNNVKITYNYKRVSDLNVSGYWTCAPPLNVHDRPNHRPSDGELTANAPLKTVVCLDVLVEFQDNLNGKE